MKVILLKDVDKVGRIGDALTVANGYARNFLIPGNMAIQATERSLKQLNHQKRIAEDRKRKEIAGAEGIKRRIESLQITIPAKVGEEEKLYGSVTAKNIQDAFAKMDVEVRKRDILLEEPIRTVGVFEVPVKLGYEVKAKAKVWVVKE